LEFVSLEYTGSLFVCRLIALSGDVKETKFSVWGYSINRQLFWLFLFLLNGKTISHLRKIKIVILYFLPAVNL
jgi:hypothetical protein